MHWKAHALLGLLLCVPSVFFLWAARLAYLSCAAECSGGPLQFASIGSVAVFLSASEFALAFKRKRETFSLMESELQRKLRRTGLVALLIGTIMLVYGFVKLNTTLVSCPASGCTPPSLWSIYGEFEFSFYGGLAIIIVGAGIVLASRFMKIPAVRLATPRALLKEA